MNKTQRMSWMMLLISGFLMMSLTTLTACGDDDDNSSTPQPAAEPEAQEPEAQEPEAQEPEPQEPEPQEPEAQEPEVDPNLQPCMDACMHVNMCGQQICPGPVLDENACAQSCVADPGMFQPQQLSNAPCEALNEVLCDQAPQQLVDSCMCGDPEPEQQPEPEPEMCEGDEIFHRLGCEDGIAEAINAFLGRVLADPAINGYFLNEAVANPEDPEMGLGACLIKQVVQATGGPEIYDCRSMAESHEGLGISQQDFDDLVAHLVAELQEREVSQEDIDAIAGVLGPLAADIVEAPENNESIYHRLGRKPGIETAIGAFVTTVLADERINAFFTETDGDRFTLCLVRQVCEATGGPCVYGAGVEEVLDGNVCATMAASHEGLGISLDDFNAVVEDLVTVLTDAGVAQEDIDAIAGVLGPLCTDIVEPNTECPTE